MKKFFNSARKNLNDKKCFDGLHADFPYSQTTENILDENQFSDFTLNRISMSGLTKIHTKAFGKTASTLKTFWSVQKSVIGHSPPKYDLWKSISQLTKLNYLGLGTNVTEIPENCISPVNGHESQLKQLHLDQYFQNPFRPKWTIKSGAFQNLNQLKSLELWGFFNKIETGAFKLNKKSDEKLNISIVSCSHFSGDLFEEGAFDGIQRPVYIDLFLRPHKTDYIPESSFKSLMDNPQNQFQFYDTQVDCDDCRNDWLIRDNRRDQAGGLTCADGSKLFDDSTVKRFKSKCT